MLLAVHLSDVVSEPWWIGGWVAAVLLVAWSVRGISESEIPRVGVMAAAFFVASQVHLPLGGASVHLLLNGLAGIVLGRRAGLAIAVGVLLQTLLFSHGGLTTLGVNVIILAVPALAAGVAIRQFQPGRRVWSGWGRFPAVAVMTAAWLVSAVVSAQWLWSKLVTGGAFQSGGQDLWARDPLVAVGIVVAALLVAAIERRIERDPAFAFGLLLGASTVLATVGLNALVLWTGGKPEVRDLAGMILLAHLPVVAVESIGLGFVVAYLARARPEWLAPGYCGSGNTSSKGTSH